MFYWVSYTVQVGTTSWKMVQPMEVRSLHELTIKKRRTGVLREAGTIWLIFHVSILSPVPLQSGDRDAEHGHWESDWSRRPLTSSAGYPTNGFIVNELCGGDRNFKMGGVEIQRSTGQCPLHHPFLPPPTCFLVHVRLEALLCHTFSAIVFTLITGLEAG